MAETLAIHGGPKVREKPFPTWPVVDGRDEAALLEVLHGGTWGVRAKKTREFERAFAAYQGCEYGVAVCNGTAALYVALMAAGVQAGNEVIVPPYTFLATASAAVQANCVPIFVDIHPETGCIDPALIEAAVTPRTKAIIPVHLGGRPADMDPVVDIARRHGLTVIEDCAQAHGAEYKHRRAGSIGDLGCFSFQSSKNLTSGEGGMIVTNDAKLHERCESIHNCGRMDRGEWYGHHIFGVNLRMTAFQSALLLAQMTRLDEQTDRRNRNGTYLDEHLAAIDGVRPQPGGYGLTRHAYHLYDFRYDADAFDGLPRERFVAAVQAEGIPVIGAYGLPLHRQPWFQRLDFGPYTAWRQTRPDLDYTAVECPVCEETCRTACWLTQSTLLAATEDMADIVAAVRKVREHRGELAE